MKKLAWLLSVLLSWSFLSPPARSQNLFAGLFRAASDAHAAWITSNWGSGPESFLSQWAEFERNGLRMVDFETYTEGAVRVYAGIFRAGNDGHAAWITSNWSDGPDSFTKKWEEWGNKGLRMVDFETYVEGGVRFYAGIFRAGNDGHAAWITSNWSDGPDSFTKKWEEFEKGGLRMIDFETWTEGRARVYAGLFRAGNDGHAAWITSNWSDGPDSFTKKWEEWNQAGLRMIDLETWEEGGARIWCGIFRAGSWAHAAWIGVDWENFTAMWNQQARNGMRLFDLEVYPSPCGNDCMNQVVMPGDACETDPPGNCVYNYWLPGGADHCEAEPGNCTGSSIGQGVWYRQPIDIFENNQRFARLSALYVEEQIFSLPFSKDEGEMGHNGWLYSPGSWHHAIDYWKKGGGTFKVRAAAPGRVIWIGWDRWSGNTVVMSHDAGGVKDKYRTIYMHLRNGPDNDCSQAWNQTVSWLSTWEDLTVYNNYKSYLNDSGCKQNSAQRNLDEARWGNDAQTINAGLLGQDVQAGTALGYAGDTGPGGCGCSTGGKGPNTHLHVFFAHRDPENNLWYFFDPYGVYGIPSCYPAGQTDFPGACTRYPVAWRGGRPQYPEDLPPLKILFRLGDSSGDGEFDITDCISTLQCLFLGLNCSRCPVAADVDNNGEVDLTDAINSLYCLFRGTDCFGLNDRRCDYDRNEDDRLGCNDAAPCLIR